VAKTPSNAGSKLARCTAKAGPEPARRTGGAPAGPGAEQRAARRASAHEANVGGKGSVGNGPPELHVCMGLNSCAGHDVKGTATMAGMGSCATVFHVCHGNNDCRGQGGCGYAGSDAEQGKPGAQACSANGSCASPINVSRVSSAGQNKGKSVWQLARQLFEQRMYEAEAPFGPSPGEGYPDDLVPPERQTE
jgi:hypothetical protein